MKIFKYEITIQDSFSIKLPAGGRILSFQVQNNKPYIWVLLDPDEKVIERYFTVKGTGHYIEELTEVLVYIGTVQMAQGDLVFHLFEDVT